MKPIDTFLWIVVAQRRHYIPTMLVIWISVLPLVRISLLLDALSGALMLATGLPTIAVAICLLLESRARFVQWQRWAWRTR